MEVDFYREHLAQSWQAASSKDCCQKNIKLASRQVRLLFSDTVIANILMPAFRHIETASAENDSDLIIYIWHSTFTELVTPNFPPSPSCRYHEFYHKGMGWGQQCQQLFIKVGLQPNRLRVYDQRDQTAYFWVEDIKDLPQYEIAAPLQEIWHWWSENWGGVLAHTAAIGLDDSGAILLAGKSGSGKSSTALTCLLAGWQYAGDDYCLLDCKNQYVHSVYGTAKLKSNEDIQRISGIRDYLASPNWNSWEKALFYLYPALQKQLIAEMSIKMIAIPKVTNNSETRALKVTGLEVFKAIAISTVAQLPIRVKSPCSELWNLCNQLPIYILELGTNTASIPKIMSALLQGAS